MRYNPENTIREAVEQTENVDFSPSVSEQMLKLLSPGEESETIVEELKKNKRLTQISPEAKDFLIDILEKDTTHLNESELKGMILSLVTNPKPSKQTEILNKQAEYLYTERGTLGKYKRTILLSNALESADEREKLRFFAQITPEEREQYSEEIQQSLEGYISSARKLEFLLDLTPKERQKYKEIEAEALRIEGSGEARISYLSMITEEERLEYKEKIIEMFKNKHDVSPKILFLAKLSPKEREVYKTELQISLNSKLEDLNSLYFYTHITPQERSLYTQEIDKAFQAEKYPKNKFEFLMKLTPEEREKYSDDLKSILKTEVSYNYRLQTYTQLTAKEREFLSKEIEECFQGDYSDSEKLFFFANITKEEREKYSRILNKTLRKTIFSEPKFDFYGNITPEERQRYTKKIRKFLKKHPDSPSATGFFAKLTPKERKEYETEITQYLEIDKNHLEKLNLFAKLNPEEREVDPKLQQAYSRMSTQLNSEIGDVGLREKYKKMLLKHLCKEDSSIIAIENIYIPQNKLAIILGIEAIGGNPLIASSWEFTPQQELNILYTLSRLSEKGKDKLLKEIKLPFRQRDKNSLGFEKSLVQWLRFIDFLTLSKEEKVAEQEKREKNKLRMLAKMLIATGVGVGLGLVPAIITKDVTKLTILHTAFHTFNAGNLIFGSSKKIDSTLARITKADNPEEKQIEKIRKQQKKHEIDQNSTNVTLKFLKEISKNVRETKDLVGNTFKKLLGIENLSTKDFESYLDSWDGEIESVLILARRLHHSYPKVKEILKAIISAEINRNYFDLRYDLSNPLVNEQMNPLIRGKTEDEKKAVIEDYHKGVILIHKVEKAEKRKQNSEKFEIEDDFKELLRENFIDHEHFDEIFDLPELRILLEKEKNVVRNFVLSPFLEKEETHLKNPKEFLDFTLETENKSLSDKIGEKTMGDLISLNQFFKDLVGNKKAPKELLNSLNKIISKLNPEARDLAFVRDDLGGFVRSQIQAQKEENQQEENPKKTFISHFSDHPKTLLEIGKHPLNSGSCQSYDYSNLNSVKSLLGYVFDSHIQAIIVRELDTDEEIIEVISIDEGRNTATIKKADLSEATVKISKPLTRSIVFLGEKDEEGVFIPQRNYSQPGKLEMFEGKKMTDDTLDLFIETLNQKHNLNLRKKETNDSGIKIAGSQNPEGHYNDSGRGQRGQQGKSYTI